ncbi:MAG: chorismate synthase [Planctomycetes bacterium]|nr:chorismate synthase [Planctomycetota bacterium]
MTELTYRTAGESHGREILAIVEGLPSGFAIDLEFINLQLARRQRGPGRGKRQFIENDAVTIPTGLLGGRTIGSPLALIIDNKDKSIEQLPNPEVPRPGHADLAGVYKYASKNIRAVLERASARETAARTAAGSVAMLFLQQFGIEVFGYVLEVGGIRGEGDPNAKNSAAIRNNSEFHALNPAAEAEWKDLIEKSGGEGDTLGGIVEIVVRNTPPGIGHYNSGSERLDGRLAAALMSIPAVKGVEIGLGFESARRKGSEVHDAIITNTESAWGGLDRATNRAGGIEGGMSNGQPIVLRIAMKPIPTLKRGLRSVNLESGEEAGATYQRSDVCSVTALSVVAESVVAFEIASAFLKKFGGDSMAEVRRAFESWKASIGELFRKI